MRKIEVKQRILDWKISSVQEDFLGPEDEFQEGYQKDSVWISVKRMAAIVGKKLQDRKSAWLTGLHQQLRLPGDVVVGNVLRDQTGIANKVDSTSTWRSLMTASALGKKLHHYKSAWLMGLHRQLRLPGDVVIGHVLRAPDGNKTRRL
ncbi:hypothetical protein HDU96_008304 [Phlyctochytrium bullatum]|nr:hypothetical protein HDU96_008304 [Phlyctochytrium bullatum]